MIKEAIDKLDADIDDMLSEFESKSSPEENSLHDHQTYDLYKSKHIKISHMMKMLTLLLKRKIKLTQSMGKIQEKISIMIKSHG